MSLPMVWKTSFHVRGPHAGDKENANSRPPKKACARLTKRTIRGCLESLNFDRGFKIKQIIKIHYLLDIWLFRTVLILRLMNITATLMPAIFQVKAYQKSCVLCHGLTQKPIVRSCSLQTSRRLTSIGMQGTHPESLH